MGLHFDEIELIGLIYLLWEEVSKEEEEEKSKGSWGRQS